MKTLFIYGSLLRGEPNHGWLAEARYLGPAKTEAAYALVDLGPYPGLVPGGEDAVAGELYGVTMSRLAELDRFEGHPTLYRRAPIRLESPTTSIVEAYLLGEERASGLPRLTPPDWRAHRRSGG